MLSRIEVANLVNAVFEGLDLAAKGLIADGYELLLNCKQYQDDLVRAVSGLRGRRCACGDW